jgi:hypothetical protein
MFRMQLGSAETPDSDKRLQEIDRHQCQCFGIYVIFKNTLGKVSQEYEDIDKNDGKECTYHECDYNQGIKN